MDTELDDLFVADDAAPSSNDFGGESDYEYTPATPEERGDVVSDDDDGDTNDDDTTDEKESGADDGDTGADDADDDASDDASDDADESDSDDADETTDDDETDDSGEEEGADEPKKKAKGSVPRSRLNKEIQKRRDLENRIRELESGAAKPEGEAPKRESQPADVKSKLSKEGFTKMQEAMIEGNTDEAFEVFAEMMSAVATEVRDEASERARQEAKEEFNANKTRDALSTAAAELAKSYPELDHQGDEADEGLIAEVVETRDLYINRGLDPVTALRKAVRIVAVDNELVDRSAPKPVKKTQANADAIAKKVALAEKTKGRLGSTGSKAPVRENRVANLSDSDFARTSAEARRRARGDYVA